MEKGHIEFGEILVMLILVTAFATAIFILTGGTEGFILTVPKLGPIELQKTSMAVGTDQQIIEVTNKTLGEIINAGMDRADARFYKEDVSGQIYISTYRWGLGYLNQTPDNISIRQNDIRASVIRFNGRYDDSLRGFAYSNYEIQNTITSPQVYAVAVFFANSTLLDINNFVNVTYDPHPQGSQILEDCTILSKKTYVTLAGNSTIKTYDLKCKLVRDVN
jgi:hypothetical protein